MRAGLEGICVSESFYNIGFGALGTRYNTYFTYTRASRPLPVDDAIFVEMILPLYCPDLG